MLSAVKAAEDPNSFTARLLLSINRAQSPTEAMKTLDMAIKLRASEEPVVGIELSGNPTKGNFEDFREVFRVRLLRSLCQSRE